jgi:hypothetical protein
MKENRESQGHRGFLETWDREVLTAFQAHRGRPVKSVRWADAELAAKPGNRVRLGRVFLPPAGADKY